MGGGLGYGLDAWGTEGWGISPTPESVDLDATVFGLDSVQVLSPILLRVRWTRVPKTVSAAEGDDATNTTNYVLTGPNAPGILVASASTDDDEVIDLHLATPASPGAWILSVNPAIVSADPTPAVLQPPLSVSFAVNGTGEAAVAAGLSTPTSFDILLRDFNPAFRGGSNWRSLLAGIAEGEDNLYTLAARAADQAYLATASGVYLTARAAEAMIARPADVGLTDADFRRFAVKLRAHKLTRHAFEAVLENLFGRLALCAFIDAGTAGPYVIADNTDILIRIQGVGDLRVSFLRSDFQIMRRAEAVEVAAVITRSADIHHFPVEAVAAADPVSGLTTLRIISKRRGITSRIEVAGGTAQPALQFPTRLLPQIGTPPIWTISRPGAEVTRLSPADDGAYNLRLVEVGDYVTVIGPEFSTANRGSWPVVEVKYSYEPTLVQYVDVANPSGAAETITQLEAGAVAVWRPTTRTILDSPTRAVVTQVDGIVHVDIPASSEVVRRRAGTGAYLKSNPATTAISIQRRPDGLTTITTTTPHGLVAGGQFRIDDAEADIPTIPTPGAGTPAGAEVSGEATGTSLSSVVSTWSADTTVNRVLAVALRDLDGDLLVVGGQSEAAGVPTGQARLDAFSVTGKTVAADGTRSHTYRWRGVAASIRPIGRFAAILNATAVLNKLLVAGGYASSPWQAIQATNLDTAGVLLTKSGSTWTSAAAAAAPVAVADAVAATVKSGGTAKVLVVGGAPATSSAAPGLNNAGTQVMVYDQVANTWVSGTALKQARTMAGAANLAGTEVLVVGGRIPADYHANDLPATTYWHFDDAAAATTFDGPVPVARNANARPPGKLGWGAACTAAMAASAGAAQTTHNTALLGNYTLSAWVTNRQGCVLRNGIAGVWAAAADNTLIAVGVDPADDKFFVRWQQGGANTTITKKTAATRTSLLAVAHDATYPRYYHVALTAVVSGGSVTFTLYVNGELVGTWTDTAPSGGSNGLWRFAAADGAITAFNGYLDHVGFSSTAYTATQVRRLYKTQVGVAYDAPTNVDSSPVGKVLETCEVVDHTGYLRRTGSMAFARFAGGLVTLPDGRLLVCGGIGYPATSQPTESAQRNLELASAEIYDPATGCWTRLPDMHDARAYPIVGYVASVGRVYVTGGFTSRRTEYLDLASMTWRLSPATLPALAARAVGGVAGADVLVVAGGATISAGVESTADQDANLGIAAETVSAGGVDTDYRVLTAPTSSTLTTQGRRARTSAVATPGTVTAAAAPDSDFKGPYVYDPQAGFTLGSVRSTSAAVLRRGRTYSELQLADASDFPVDGGWVVFRLGSADQVGPVRYIRRTDSTHLTLDANFVFPVDLAAGVFVDLVVSPDPFVPADPVAAGSLYVTAGSAATVAARQLLKEISASGIEIEVQTRYPSDFGLGNAGEPTSGASKLSDVVPIFAGNAVDEEVEAARG
jgi:hypothetical protein